MKWLLSVGLLLAAFTAQAAVEVIDDTGARVRLDKPATRVISIAPHLTEQLFAIGAGDKVIAATEFSDYPAAARTVPRIGKAHHIDLERVAALKPDLIAIWGSGYPPAMHAALARLGVPIFVSEPKALDDIAGSMQRLGVLTAAPDGERAAAALRSEIAALRATYARRKPVKVFYEIWPQPLMTLSGKHVVSEAIALCGGINVFADLAPLAPQVSEEAVLAANPDVIASAEADGKPSGALERWKRWPQIAAVKRGALVTLTAEHINRHGPRMALGVAEMCRALDALR